MSRTKSYDINLVHRDADAELQRLRAQALLTWGKEARTLGWFGLQDGMSVIELGCGPGFVTEQLLALLPHGSVTALDVDPVLIDEAQAYLKEHLESHGDAQRLRLVQASIHDTGLPDDSFDFAVARMVFQHLADPVAAAREVLRILKPGGKLVITDIDDSVYGIFEPHVAEFSSVLEALGRAQAARGGNRHIGRRLWRILEEAGFCEPDLELVISHSDALGMEPFLPMMDPDRFRRLVDAGFLSSEAWEALRRACERFHGAPAPYGALLLFLACGKKP